jgi:hypothetical protein
MQAARTALAEALTTVRPGLGELSRRLSEASPQAQPAEPFDDAANDQFLNAFETVVREGLEGGGQTREFIFSTAVPALVAAGQTPEMLVHGHVAFFVVFCHRLLATVGDDVREDAEVWLSGFFADYVAEVDRVARAAQADLG